MCVRMYARHYYRHTRVCESMICDDLTTDRMLGSLKQKNYMKGHESGAFGLGSGVWCVKPGIYRLGLEGPGRKAY